MIVHDPYLIGLTIPPPEDNAPLLVDPDRIEGSYISAQPFQTVRWWHCKVMQSAGRIDCLQLALRPAGNPLKIGYELIKAGLLPCDLRRLIR